VGAITGYGWQLAARRGSLTDIIGPEASASFEASAGLHGLSVTMFSDGHGALTGAATGETFGLGASIRADETYTTVNKTNLVDGMCDSLGLILAMAGY
jgi:hypothetical protein